MLLFLQNIEISTSIHLYLQLFTDTCNFFAIIYICLPFLTLPDSLATRVSTEHWSAPPLSLSLSLSLYYYSATNAYSTEWVILHNAHPLPCYHTTFFPTLYSGWRFAQPYPTLDHPNPTQPMGCAQFSTSEKLLLLNIWFKTCVIVKFV